MVGELKTGIPIDSIHPSLNTPHSPSLYEQTHYIQLGAVVTLGHLTSAALSRITPYTESEDTHTMETASSDDNQQKLVQIRLTVIKNLKRFGELE